MTVLSLRSILLGICMTLTCALQVAAQTTSSTTSSTRLTKGTSTVLTTSVGTTTTSSTASTASPPDVYLDVPKLSVGTIALDVEDLYANINLNANVAQLVTISAGVQISIAKANLTITDVEAELELIVRLGNLVAIVNRVFESLDLNPLLISAVNNVTSLVSDVVGEVGGLLGSITQGGTTVDFVIDNLGNIVSQVNGVSTIVGNYVQNMTYTGQSTNLGSGLVEKVYSYSPLNALVDLVFNTAGQLVQATVEKATGSSTSTTTAATGTSTATKL